MEKLVGIAKICQIFAQIKKRTTTKVLLLLFIVGPGLNAQDKPSDYLTSEFHKERRSALRNILPQNSVAVLFANAVRNRANDVDYVYHQDPDFYYLTGYKEPHAVLLIFSASQKSASGANYDEIIFVQPKNKMMGMWTGLRMGPDQVQSELGLKQAFDNTEFSGYDIDFDKFDKILFFNFQEDIRDVGYNQADLFDLKAQFKNKAKIPAEFNGSTQRIYSVMKDPKIDFERKKQMVFGMSRMNPRILSDPLIKEFMESKDVELSMKITDKIPDSNLDVGSLPQLMGQLRETKSKEELRLMRIAAEVSAVGQIEVMKAMKPHMSETEVQGIHEFVFKKYGAEYEGYPSIVGAGRNGCILHYIDNTKPRLGSDLVLMDLGAEYHGYTADVTRTIPADGTFSEEQKIIYNIVLEAQQAGFEECRVGNEFGAPNLAAKEVINKRLAEVGIIEEGASHFYFPHGTSHYVGLDVHDRGTGGPFKPNTIITVEPGIYIPEGSDCDEKWWGIAVRIEDDILITEDGWKNLSGLAPRTVEDIEKTMAQRSALDDFILPELKDRE